MKRRCQVRHGLAVIGIHIMNKKLWKKILIAITTATAAILCMGALSYILWNNGVFLPRWIQWENRTFYSQSYQYKIVLSHKSVSIISDNTVIWTSPEAIKIQDAISCDMDNDRQDELILLCWKIGRYGNDKPFWVEKDEKNGHSIFLYMNIPMEKSVRNGCHPISDKMWLSYPKTANQALSAAFF